MPLKAVLNDKLVYWLSEERLKIVKYIPCAHAEPKATLSPCVGT